MGNDKRKQLIGWLVPIVTIVLALAVTMIFVPTERVVGGEHWGWVAGTFWYWKSFLFEFSDVFLADAFGQGFLYLSILLAVYLLVLGILRKNKTLFIHAAVILVMGFVGSFILVTLGVGIARRFATSRAVLGLTVASALLLIGFVYTLLSAKDLAVRRYVEIPEIPEPKEKAEPHECVSEERIREIIREELESKEEEKPVAPIEGGLSRAEVKEIVNKSVVDEDRIREIVIEELAKYEIVDEEDRLSEEAEAAPAKPAEPVEAKAEEKPAETVVVERVIERIIERPVEKPVEEQPAEPTEEQPVEQSAEEQPVEEQAAEPAEEQPAEAVAEEPAEQQPVERVIERIVEKPVEVVVEKPVEVAAEQPEETPVVIKEVSEEEAGEKPAKVVRIVQSSASEEDESADSDEEKIEDEEGDESEDLGEEEGGEEVVIIDPNNPVAAKYPNARRRLASFETKLKGSEYDLRHKYYELRDHIKSYGVNNRISRNGDTFSLHREKLVHISISGKHLKMAFALDPTDYEDSSFPVTVNSSKKFADLPLGFKVKSDLSFRRAKKLVDDVMVKHGYAKNED